MKQDEGLEDVSISDSTHSSMEKGGREATCDSDESAIFGLSVRYGSLLALSFQNAFLTIISHQSRVYATPGHVYSAASAVLAVELLKGAISLAIVYARVDVAMSAAESHLMYFPSRTDIPYAALQTSDEPPSSVSVNSWGLSYLLPFLSLDRHVSRFRRVLREVLSADSWMLSIPAIFYVIQNNLYFVAISNLDVATFQVTSQMKILTTAFFSVLLLGKQLRGLQWLSLLFLAIGVGVVQMQATGKHHPPSYDLSKQSGVALSSGLYCPPTHTMYPILGFAAVCASCLSSGIAGVYFEMVLKNSPADLWVRNVQLSLFSLVPAIAYCVLDPKISTTSLHDLLPTLFHDFTILAWGTVLTQVAGGLLTAIVIKYADNILKAFATSLSILLAFLASIGLFGSRVTGSFVFGASLVLGSIYLYSRPPPGEGKASELAIGSAIWRDGGDTKEGHDPQSAAEVKSGPPPKS